MVVPVRPVQFVGPAVLVAGLLTLALAVSRGEASVYLLLVIPAVVGTGPLAFLGLLLVFVGLPPPPLLWPRAGAGPSRPGQGPRGRGAPGDSRAAPMGRRHFPRSSAARL